MLAPFYGRVPNLRPDTFVAPSADVIGDVTVGAECSIWYQAVLRGDVNWIRLGNRCNVQDGTVVHVTRGSCPTWIGDDVSIGHSAIIHGCTIHDRVLVGMGAVLMDDVEIGEECLIGARALVTQGTRIPPGSLVLGSPARVARPLTPEELALVRGFSQRYVAYSRSFLAHAEGLVSGENPYYERPDDLSRPPVRGRR